MDPKQIPIIKDSVRDMISYAQDLEEYFSSLFFAFFFWVEKEVGIKQGRKIRRKIC